MSGPVISQHVFGVFLDLGDALGIMELPALPRYFGTSPALGTELAGYVVRRRDQSRQIDVVSEDPISDGFFRELVAQYLQP